MKNKEYFKVRNNENPELRQRFIEGIELGEVGKYVNKVIYEPNQLSDGDFEFYMAMDISYSPNEKKDIFVFPKAFDIFKNFKDFFGTLKYHEGYHAKESFEGEENFLRAEVAIELGFSNVEFLAKSRIELRAYNNQIDNLNKMDFSSNYSKAIHRKFEYQTDRFRMFERIVKNKERDCVSRIIHKFKQQKNLK